MHTFDDKKDRESFLKYFYSQAAEMPGAVVVVVPEEMEVAT